MFQLYFDCSQGSRDFFVKNNKSVTGTIKNQCIYVGKNVKYGGHFTSF